LDAGVDYRRGHRRTCGDIHRDEDALTTTLYRPRGTSREQVVAAEGERLYSIHIRPHKSAIGLSGDQQKEVHDGQLVGKGRARMDLSEFVKEKATNKFSASRLLLLLWGIGVLLIWAIKP